MTRYTDDQVHEDEDKDGTVNEAGDLVYPNGDDTWSTRDDLDEDAAEYLRMCEAGENVNDISLEEFISNRRRAQADTDDQD